jgi:general L-amino acid transport system substrate-binding protein
MTSSFAVLGRRLAGLAAATTMILAAMAPSTAGTLEDVRERGTLRCGVSQGLLGFSSQEGGTWSGFDVDFCKAVAAAVLMDPAKVEYVPLSASERFDALKVKKIDLLSRNSTWTLEREALLGLLFAGITYHDGQGFMVDAEKAVTSALELGGSTVCVETGTTSQKNAADFFRANNMAYTEKAFPTSAEALEAFRSKGCDVLTRDQSALYAERLKLADPATAVILPDVISKEPLAPATRADDIVWFNVVRWTVFALVNAEELGISSKTLPEALKSQRPDVRRFTGAEGGLGTELGLDDAFAVRIVEAVGNYGEMYEKNVGSQSKLGIPRGLNQLWSAGGILYAPPLR